MQEVYVRVSVICSHVKVKKTQEEQYLMVHVQAYSFGYGKVEEPDG